MTKLRNRALRPSGLRSNYFPFTGGLNLVDPALSITPGECISADNFEVDIRGRYQRVDGYERADGQTLPSEITYYRIPFTTGTSLFEQFDAGYDTSFLLNIPSPGDLIKGVTTGAVGVILQVTIEGIEPSASGGSFSNNNAQGHIYYSVVSGQFQIGETINILNADSAYGSAFSVEYK
jgi:hypothetical protein